MTIMMVAFVFLQGTIGASGSNDNYVLNTDNYGHLGGLITGVFAGVLILKPISANNYEKKAKMIFGGCLALFFVLTFVLFYTATSV